MTRLGLILLAVTLGGCASVSPERGHDQVASVVGERTGHKTRWEKGPPDDAEIADWVRKVSYQQAKLDLQREEVNLLEARERVNRLLGLWGEPTGWRFAEQLPPMPDADPKLEHLESFAMSRRLDVAVAKRRAALLSKGVDLARSTRLVGWLDVGVDMHQDPNGPLLLGPNLVIELPIFDQRQAVVARLEAQRREMERRLQEVAIDARSEVRLAALRLSTGREVVAHYHEVLVPLRKTVTEQALLHYNGMFRSTFQLLAAKESEIDARRGYLEALRDYWIARAELARALGGSLPFGSEGDHHGN